MYSLGYDLVVNDESIIKEAEALGKKAAKFERQLTILLDILGNVLGDAVMEGNISDNLALFLEEARGLQGEGESIAEELRAVVTNYVASMDEADSYVY